MLENLPKYSYSLIVTVLYLSIYFFFFLKIRKAEKRKLKSIRNRDIGDAVETESPVDDQEKVLKKKGITGLEDRFSFINKAFPVVLLALWLITLLFPHLGSVPSVYISTITAITSVVVGISLRPFLENLFSGVVISFFRSIKIGDTVIYNDHYGLIEEIALTYTVLRKWDWNRIVIPNTKLLQSDIQNLSMNDEYIWAHIEFYVSPGTDLIKLRQKCIELACESKYFVDFEKPSFWVMDMEKDSIKCWLAAWSDNPANAWELRNEMRTSLVLHFKSNEISFQKININTLNTAHFQV